MTKTLKQIEERIAQLWPGAKTQLSLILAAVAPIAALGGYYVDPDTVIVAIEDLGDKLLALEAALIGLAMWCRRLTKIYQEIIEGRR